MLTQRARPDRIRFGIGEWYGRLYHTLNHVERRYYAQLQSLARKSSDKQACPFLSTNQIVYCSKAGGVCSVRRYVQSADDGNDADLVRDETGRLRTVCPNRFREAGMVHAWVGEVLLNESAPTVINEVGFLSSVAEGGDSGDDIGRIDQVLVRPDSTPLEWCALETQAVYLSGNSIQRDFRATLEYTGTGIPFPAGRRHPDYRSSGPKRLMPQLQIKVPSLRRWGKKMAVVVDRAFFEVLAPMGQVNDISNSDITWFVVDLIEDEAHGVAHLAKGATHMTTLERAVEGLTAGVPVAKEEFERRILSKLRVQSRAGQTKDG
jgi:hypothetical protein